MGTESALSPLHFRLRISEGSHASAQQNGDNFNYVKTFSFQFIQSDDSTVCSAGTLLSLIKKHWINETSEL